MVLSLWRNNVCVSTFRLAADEVFDRPIVTQIAPLSSYYPAEAYHQRYFERNPYQGYCMAVVGPKVAKFRKQFLDRLKRRTTAG